MTEEPEDPWKQLTRAARSAPQEPLSPTIHAPRASDFRKKVTALFLTLLWRRSSLIIALIAGLAWLCVVLLGRYEKSQTPLIPLPSDNPTDPAQP